MSIKEDEMILHVLIFGMFVALGDTLVGQDVMREHKSMWLVTLFFCGLMDFINTVGRKTK
jgi:hypothetical protein